MTRESNAFVKRTGYYLIKRTNESLEFKIRETKSYPLVSLHAPAKKRDQQTCVYPLGCVTANDNPRLLICTPWKCSSIVIMWQRPQLVFDCLCIIRLFMEVPLSSSSGSWTDGEPREKRLFVTWAPPLACYKERQCPRVRCLLKAHCSTNDILSWRSWLKVSF